MEKGKIQLIKWIFEPVVFSQPVYTKITIDEREKGIVLLTYYNEHWFLPPKFDIRVETQQCCGISR